MLECFHITAWNLNVLKLWECSGGGGWQAGIIWKLSGCSEQCAALAKGFLWAQRHKVTPLIPFSLAYRLWRSLIITGECSQSVFKDICAETYFSHFLTANALADSQGEIWAQIFPSLNPPTKRWFTLISKRGLSVELKEYFPVCRIMVFPQPHRSPSPSGEI